MPLNASVPREVRGMAQGAGLRIAVVWSRFNEDLVSLLVQGARHGLRHAGVGEQDSLIVSVPGAFELGPAAKHVIEHWGASAAVCLGVVIRGETDHYDFVCSAAQQGVLQASMFTGVPVSFGVLTVRTGEQAMERCADIHSNKGFEAAVGAVETALLYRSVTAAASG